MNFKKKFISVLIILLFISISSVSATELVEENGLEDNYCGIDEISLEINDSRINDISIELNDYDLDENLNKGEINKSKSSLSDDNALSFSELQSQIYSSSSGDIIGLQANYAYDDGFKVNGISIDRTLTIDGNGMTLDGKNTGRIFYITGENVVIRNLNFVNGLKDTGGAIFFKSTGLTIENCSFSSNNAEGSLGGAAYIISNDSIIKNSFFYNNYASSSGGAIRIEGNNNLIEDNIFSGNIANSSLGGAICALGHNITIKNNSFTGNSAGRDGGAIDIEGTTVASQGINNLIEENTFSANSAIYGGAISINGENDTVIKNYFSRNFASELGGALRWVGSSKITGLIGENTFLYNIADKSGGAMYIVGNLTDILQNTFNNNKANNVSGGSITIRGNNLTILNNIFNQSSTNTSGGSVYLDGINSKLFNNIFTLSNSGTSGGALYIIGDGADIENNQFISNNAGTLAGSLHLKSNNALVYNNNFHNNTSQNSGGAGYIEGNSISILNNNFTSNNALSSSVGGAFRFIGNNSTINDNRFESNLANSGYAIYGTGNDTKLNNNSFIDKTTDDKVFKWEGTNNLKKLDSTLTLKAYSFTSTATKTLSATIKDIYGNLVANKKLKFTVNGKNYYATSNAKGVASVKITLLNKGSYTYTVSFDGDDNYGAVKSSAKLTVTLASTTISVKKYTFKKASKTKKLSFTLKSGNTLLKSKKITLKINGKTYSAKTNSKGIATVKIILTKKGTFKYTVKFAGDTTYKAISKSQKVIIK